MIDRLVTWARRLRPEQVHQARTAGLTIAGLGLLSAAAWVIALPLGLAAAGVSCLVIEHLTGPGEPHGRP